MLESYEELKRHEPEAKYPLEEHLEELTERLKQKAKS